MSFLLLLAISSVGIAAYVAAEAASVSSRERRTAVRRAVTYGRVRRKLVPGRDELRARATPLKETLARWVLRVTPRLSMESVSAKLLTAGLARRVSPTGFLALKGGLAIAGVVLGVLLGLGLLMSLLVGLGGFFAPDAYATLRARRRKNEARVQLPDALDILAVSVEAGLGFDAAIAKLIDHMEGALSEEFALTLGEMRIGRSRQDALRGLAARLETPEIDAFVRAVVQADQLGLSLGKILRVQAADTRDRRQAAAEEKAMKAPVKMIFPTALFIFPAIFIVILGPAFLSFGDVF